MTARERLDRLVASVDPAGLELERWFAGKGRTISKVELVDGITVEGEGLLAFVDVAFDDDGECERYSLLHGGRLWGELLRLLRDGSARGALGGSFSFDGELPPMPTGEEPIGADQSNTSFRLGDELLVKCYRRLWPGSHPEVELVAYLGSRLASVPCAWGALRYVDPEGVAYELALVQAFVPDALDGWAWGHELYERLAAGDRIDGRGDSLGATIAALHVALANGLGARESTRADRSAWQARAARELARALEVTAGEAATRLRAWAPPIEAELSAFDSLPRGWVSRIHGDLHMGQILASPAGFFVIDFEGEPTKPPEERRSLDSPTRDVASLVRSFEHVPRWVLRDRPEALPAALAWAAEQRQLFLDAYGRGIGGSPLTLDAALLRVLEVEKATYELVYAATFMPEWTPIATGAMDALLRES